MKRTGIKRKPSHKGFSKGKPAGGEKRAVSGLWRSGKGIRANPDRELALWSKKVRERDDYTCQMSGVRDVDRNIAHHVAPRSRRPDLRLDVDNGITLTPEAHRWVHDHPIEATGAGYLSDATFEKARKDEAASAQRR